MGHAFIKTSIHRKRPQRRLKNHRPLFDFCVFSCALCGEFFSKFQLDAKLNLKWIEDIAWRTEARDRRIVQIAAAVERGDVTYVNPVEQIEEINAEFTVQSFCPLDRRGYPNIDRTSRR